MEKYQSLKSFPCKLHPNEFVQRVSIDSNTNNCLRCIECILSNPDEVKKQSVVNLNEFIDRVVNYYKTTQPTTITLGNSAPNDLVEFLSRENETLDNFSTHIENEKDKVKQVFSTLLQEFSSQCKQKQKEIIELLDKQLGVLKLNFTYYRGKLNKFYGESENDSYDKEKLVTKINECKDTNEMEAFIKDIRDTLSQNSQSTRQTTRNQAQEGISNLAMELKIQMSQLSKTKFHNAGNDDVLSEFNKLTALYFDNFKIENLFYELTLIPSCIDSKIIQDDEDISLVKSWVILDEGKVSFRLCYRGSRDGFDAQTFHKLCDDYSPTLTIVKTTNGNIIGGYSDQTWKHSETRKFSDKAWIFNLTNKKQYPIRSNFRNQAIHANRTFGPCFGNGDMTVQLENKAGVAQPNSRLQSLPKLVYFRPLLNFGDEKEIQSSQPATSTLQLQRQNFSQQVPINFAQQFPFGQQILPPQSNMSDPFQNNQIQIRDTFEEVEVFLVNSI